MGDLLTNIIRMCRELRPCEGLLDMALVESVSQAASSALVELHRQQRWEDIDQLLTDLGKYQGAALDMLQRSNPGRFAANVGKVLEAVKTVAQQSHDHVNLAPDQSLTPEEIEELLGGEQGKQEP